MSKILVTGGAGFIGTNLIELLVKKGHSVTSVDNYDSGFTTNHIKDVTYIDYDIIDVLDYSAWGEFEVIFHLAPSKKEAMEIVTMSLSNFMEKE